MRDAPGLAQMASHETDLWKPGFRELRRLHGPVIQRRPKFRLGPLLARRLQTNDKSTGVVFSKSQSGTYSANSKHFAHAALARSGED
jgi:hypothetical protein